MTDHFWKKANHLFGFLPLAAIFALLVVSANVEIKDLDLWLHLAMGRFITLHRTVPSVDVLSCSIAGAPWVNHEWLFQVMVYNIFHLWGASGLIMMQVVVVSLTMLLLLCIGYDKNRQLLTTIILFLVYMIYQQRFTIRPDLFSLLFFTVYIFVLSLHIDKKWSLPVLFFTQVLWSNTHGFFFFGPLFVLIGIVSEWMRRNVYLPYEWNESGRLNDDEYHRIKKIFIYVVVACLFNPLLAVGAWYPISVFFSLSGENKIFFEVIQELRQSITPQTLFDQSQYGYYKLMIVISFISFIFNRRRIDVSALLFWLVFLVFSLKAVRNTPFFAFAAYLVFITNIVNINADDIIPIRFTQKKFQYLTAMIVKILFLLWVFGFYQEISLRSYYDFDRYELKSEYGGISQSSYPDKAVDFLVVHQVKGNFFNDFNSGAYLLGRTHPDIKVFIDGRTEVYGGTFFQMYKKIWEDGDVELFEKIVKRYKITGALLNSSRQMIPEKILSYLFQHEDWRLVYFDYDAVIFLKNNPMNKPLIDQFEIDLARWKAPEIDLYKFGTLRVKPYRPYYRAYTLESLGFDDAALEELDQAIRVDPFYADAFDLAGKIYAKRKEYRKAFEHFRIAVTASPRTKKMRFNLALSYFDLGEYEGAVKQYKTISKMWPNDPKGHFLLTKSRIMNGQYAEAIMALKQAHQLSPQDVKDPLELGDMMFEQKAYKEAKEAYFIALKTNKEQEVIYKKLGFVSLSMGDKQQAKQEFEKALAVTPDNEEIKSVLKDLD
ncbi:MAG: tetratricopeptide repeat protein [Candidatus Omnitrophica bacterium]|nr:tetratricopeptide repeat protein [Candidatus Omnitrophota bacterium]